MRGTLTGGFQRGPQHLLAHRPCAQGLVCYTSAEGMLLGCCDHAGLSMPQFPSRWLYPAFSQAVCLCIPAAEVYRFPPHRLRSNGFAPCENLCYNDHNYT